MTVQRLMKRCQHEEGGYRTTKPTKVVRRWLQLAELAAPQSDHQPVCCCQKPASPGSTRDEEPAFLSNKSLSVPQAKEDIQVTRSPGKSTPGPSLPPFCHPYLTTTASGPPLSLPFPLRRDLSSAPRPPSPWSTPEGQGPRTPGLGPRPRLRTTSHTSQGPSSVQMEVIWLWFPTDFTNDYVMLVHTHSHNTSSPVPFPLTQAVPRSENGSRPEGTWAAELGTQEEPKTWAIHNSRLRPHPAQPPAHAQNL